MHGLTSFYYVLSTHPLSFFLLFHLLFRTISASIGGEHDGAVLINGGPDSFMELTDLSLATTQLVGVSESENKGSKKRKMFPPATTDDQELAGPPLYGSIDLHVKNPLPLNWEQCLDLESGRKYYLNRKTLRKSWNCPKDQPVDLDLNISSSTCITQTNQDRHNASGGGNNTVALACLNCHLLVILSGACPACPNCKYVHSLPAVQTGHLPRLHKVSHVKPLDTLSLLN